MEFIFHLMNKQTHYLHLPYTKQEMCVPTNVYCSYVKITMQKPSGYA